VRVDRIVVDAWDPSYAAPFDVDEALERPPVDVDVEVPGGAWAPVDAGAVDAAREVLFVDGVQRVDARVTLVDGREAVMGMAGSFAAGAVRCAGRRAAVEQVEVRRGLFTRASDVALVCGAGVRYAPIAVPDTSTDALLDAMTEQMRALEKVLADDAAAELVVIDGPLSGGRHVPGALGLVKTHRRAYLEEPQLAVVAALGPGQRTPVFLTKTSFSRFSWYLRLPGPRVHPWAGVVRCEASGDLPLAEVRRLAACASATLPRFASTPHRDPRAPQNLTPIGALERHLRHRLGDPAILDRMLRRTCAAWRPPAA
jgi:hypothetical protein